MQYYLKKLNPAIAFAVLVGLGPVLPTLAQSPFEYFERRNKTEVYGIGQFLSSKDINFNGPNGGTIPLHMDNTGLGGFGIAYHFNDFIAIHGDFMFGGATFHGTVPLEQGGTFNINQDAFIQSGRFNIDYNIINRRITPFLTAGIGYQYIETELKNLPPANYCWWDPWWGYVCTSSQPYAWQTDFTWNAGAGLRWNITDHLMVKATGGATWLEYGGSHGVTTQLEAIFAIGYSW